MKKRVIFTAVIMAILSVFTIFADSLPREYFVFDEADILSAETEKRINTYSAVLLSEFGLELIVATASDIGNYGIEHYSADLFESLELDSSKENNDILITLAPSVEDYCVLIGKGLSEYITASKLDEMLFEHLEQPFSEGSYDSGVSSIYDAIYEKVTDIYNTNNTKKSSHPLLGVVIFLSLILVIAIAVLLIMHRRAVILARKQKEKARKLQNLKRRRAEHRSNVKTAYYSKEKTDFDRSYNPPRRYDNLPRR